MSKTLEEIQAEIAATAAAMATPGNQDASNSAAAPSEAPAASEAAAPAPMNVADLLDLLAAKTGLSVDSLMEGIDRAAGGSGEAATILPEGTKTYYTSTPNCGIMVQTGPASCERVEFKGDTLHTTDPEVIAYMDKIVDRPGSGIFSKSHRQVSSEVTAMRAELDEVARKHHARMVAAGEKLA